MSKDKDDYTVWCENFKNNEFRNHIISVIHDYLVEDGVINSGDIIKSDDCNNDEMYFSRQCVYNRALTIGKKFEKDLSRMTKSEEIDILYKMWRIHPSLREICPGSDTQYYKAYLQQLSILDSNLFTYVRPLSSEYAKEIRNEVNELCSDRPQDPFCTVKLAIYFVNMYERLPSDQANWHAREKNYKEAILLNYIVLKTNNPEKFSEFPPAPSTYTKSITRITDVMLNYMFNDDMIGLAEYALFLPSVDFYKCGGIACDGDQILCTFMKIVTQTRVFLKTNRTPVQGLLKHNSKFIQTNTNFRRFLLQNNLDRILDLVTTQQKSSTIIGSHIIESIRIDLQNVTAELKNEFSKTVNSRFSELKSYFKSVHEFDKKISDADINLITTNVKSLQKTMKELGSQVQNDVYILLKAAVHVMGAEVADRTIKVAVSIVQNIFTVFNPAEGFGVPDVSDTLDRIDDLTNAIVGLKRAKGLQNAIGEVKDKSKSITNHLKENERLLKIVQKIVDKVKENDKFEILDPKLQETFLDEYAKYVPTLGTSDIVEVGTFWEVLIDEACDLIYDEATGTIAGGIKSEELDNTLCWRTKIKAAKLTEVYIEIYDFQFEMIDALAVYMRAQTGSLAAENINTHFTKLKSRDPKSSETLEALDATARFTLLIYKMHTFQTVILYCDFLEYKNGGVKPDVCQGFNTDVSLLASTVIPTCNNRFHQIFNNMPTKPSHLKDTAFVNLAKLYQGFPIIFKIPNSEWLVKKGWITEREKDFAIYVEQFEIYLPSHSETVLPVSVVAKTTSGSLVHPDGTRYLIFPNQPLEYKYIKGPISSCRQRMFRDPYGICETTKTEEVNKICPSSITETKNELYPSIYSQWTLTVTGFENFTVPKPSTDLPLTVGLKICTRDKRLTMKRRRRFNRPKKSVFGCCEEGQYWDNSKASCSACPDGTKPALDGYYCNHE